MPSDDFHARPFDEGTLEKLELFELYAREWLPVFLSSTKPVCQAIHVFDFFAGPGTDVNDVPGSPLRLLRQVKAFQGSPGWSKVRITAHFFDDSDNKIARLKANVQTKELLVPRVTLDVRPLSFEEAFASSIGVLSEPRAAKLVFIDQTGVSHVSPEVFAKLIDFPTCDFLFFISSSTLHRFHEHPAIKQKIERPNDHYHVHRAAYDFYRALLPPGKEYFLGRFSIKKGANIYGVIFGSAHPRGIDKFLQIAWRNDEVRGEANFDIDRENLAPGIPVLFDEMRPSKLSMFEQELEMKLRGGQLRNELDVMRMCFNHGMKRQHAKPVLQRLKKQGVIRLNFSVPDIDRIKNPRPIGLLST